MRRAIRHSTPRRSDYRAPGWWSRDAFQLFHVVGIEVADAPMANLAVPPQGLEAGNRFLQRYGTSPMQQIQIEVIGAEAREACRTGAGNAVSRHLVGLDLRNEVDPLARACDHMAQELLGAAVAIIAGGIEQRHAERKAGAHRLLLVCIGMPSLAQVSSNRIKGR